MQAIPRSRRPRVWRLIVGCCLCGVVFLLLSTSGAVRAQAPFDLTINSVDGSAFPAVVAYVTVLDDTGHAVVDLGPRDFSGAENDVPITELHVEWLENAGEPIVLALVLDTSGSMQGQPIRDTQAAATQLISSLGPADEVTVISFASEVTTQLELSTDKAAATAVVATLEARGGTALNDALHEALTQLARRPRGRKVLVLLTDGADTDSILTLDDGINAARAGSIPVYAIGFGAGIQPAVLERLALLTGGHFYASPSSEELAESFDAVARLLRYQYVLRYDSTQPASGTQHTLWIAAELEGVQAHAERTFVAERRELSITMQSPAAGATVGGPVTLRPEITAPAEVVEVQYWLDGAPLATMVSTPFAYAWDTQGVPTGTHTLRVSATDRVGNTGETSLSLIVALPIVAQFTSPAPESVLELTGEVPLEIAVTAVVEVVRVVFEVDGEELGVCTTSPYRLLWDTRTAATGEHRVTATAYDLHGHSAQVELTVWVGFRGGQWGIWAALAIVLGGSGVVLPLAMRRRRRLRQNAALLPPVS